MVMKSLGAMKRMSIGVGFFAMIVIFPTAIIGMTGAVKYGNLTTADFLSRVLIHDHPDIIATLIMIGLVAAAISTSDSQIFALGSELRSILKGDEKKVLNFTKVGMLLFALFAFLFSLISSDQLVLLARVSFAGTAMLGPMVLIAVFARNKVDSTILWVSLMMVILFIVYLAGWLPEVILGIQFDLLLFFIIFGYGAILLLIPKKENKK
jgi:SSS family solute:Na+ symporter